MKKPIFWLNLEYLLLDIFFYTNLKIYWTLKIEMFYQFKNQFSRNLVNLNYLIMKPINNNRPFEKFCLLGTCKFFFSLQEFDFIGI